MKEKAFSKQIDRFLDFQLSKILESEPGRGREVRLVVRARVRAGPVSVFSCCVSVNVSRPPPIQGPEMENTLEKVARHCYYKCTC